MKRKLNNQRGAIDIILILVVFVLAAGLGGYVYYNQQQAKKVYDAAGSGATVSKHVKKKPAPAPDPTADWVAFSSVKGKFSLKYPKTWFLPEHKELCTASLFDRAIFLGPTQGTVLKCATEYFGQISVSSVDGDKRTDEAFDATTYGSIDKAAATSVAGVTGERMTATVIKVPEGPVPLTVGDKEVRYVFYTAGVTYEASYRIPKTNSASDVTSDFDTMITKTLKFI